MVNPAQFIGECSTNPFPPLRSSSPSIGLEALVDAFGIEVEVTGMLEQEHSSRARTVDNLPCSGVGLVGSLPKDKPSQVPALR